MKPMFFQTCLALGEHKSLTANTDTMIQFANKASLLRNRGRLK